MKKESENDITAHVYNKPFSRKCILPQDFSFAITFTLAYDAETSG